MKLTWFGASTFRIHAGGAILVVEPESVGAGIDPAELVSGADLVVRFAQGEAPTDSAAWKPRAPLRPLEADEQNRAPEIFALTEDCLVVDADGEAPLVIACGTVPSLGKWADKAVFVLSGIHGYLSGAVRKFAEDRNTKPSRHWRIVNEIPTVLMIVIVILVVVKPF